jgi:broad specificity phosphatase PhoE
VFKRAELARDYLKQELQQGNVAIVTHSNFTKHFTLHLNGEWQKLDNCGVLRLSLA